MGQGWEGRVEEELCQGPLTLKGFRKVVWKPTTVLAF